LQNKIKSEYEKLIRINNIHLLEIEIFIRLYELLMKKNDANRVKINSMICKIDQIIPNKSFVLISFIKEFPCRIIRLSCAKIFKGSTNSIFIYSTFFAKWLCSAEAILQEKNFLMDQTTKIKFPINDIVELTKFHS